MPIYVGSRHEFDSVYNVPHSDGNNHYTVYGNIFNYNRSQPTDPYRLHIVSDGERLDSLAATYYGDPELWWVIADANPDTAYDPMFIAVGTLLRIPNEARQ